MKKYMTLKNYGEDSFEEKKSEFIGYAKRVTTEEEAKEFVAEIKNQHKTARHNCYAYIIGEIWGYKDILMMESHKEQLVYLYLK